MCLALPIITMYKKSYNMYEMFFFFFEYAWVMFPAPNQQQVEQWTSPSLKYSMGRIKPILFGSGRSGNSWWEIKLRSLVGFTSLDLLTLVLY